MRPSSVSGSELPSSEMDAVPNPARARYEIPPLLVAYFASAAVTFAVIWGLFGQRISPPTPLLDPFLWFGLAALLGLWLAGSFGVAEARAFR
jgi:hypothetical protein